MGRWLLTLLIVACVGVDLPVHGDGKVMPPRNYKGSLEERAQEAVIVFVGSTSSGGGIEDLVLKITVEGAADNFAWIVPFPSEPEVARESPKLFRELFDYVQRQSQRRYNTPGGKSESSPGGTDSKVEVLKREIVGNFDVAIVRESAEGGLNPWLKREGYQELTGADDVLEFYRERNYVFACIKVSDTKLAEGAPVESHPLRFTFKTGGRDGIYYPMKLSGLGNVDFDVNLYVFYRFWVNDRINRYGYQHKELRLNYRDWDSGECVANGGKAWSDPGTDPFLRRHVRLLSTVSQFFKARHPGRRFYLTNIQARFSPQVVRTWPSDLWLFPYYTTRSMVPFDARQDGPAATGYPVVRQSSRGGQGRGPSPASPAWPASATWSLVAAVVLAGLGIGIMAWPSHSKRDDAPIDGTAAAAETPDAS